MLEINNIRVSYGKVEVIKNVSFHIEKGEVVVIIGANGAGKTTIMRTITGLMKPSIGSIVFKGQDISKISAERIVAAGITMCPEGRQVFPQHTVSQNLKLGAYLIRHNRKLVQERMEKMYELFPILKERQQQLAGTLSGGEQQMLAIARAMMVDPELLLLDEPSAGLAPIYVKNTFDMIKKLSERGTTILLVEQMAKMALGVADRAYVLETGRIVISGSAQEIMHDPRVEESYLGQKKS
jgi:branched-chain amino acid transport system ATP-binding protein